MDNEEKISIEDFAKLNIKIGKILSAEKVPEADKLIKLMIDIGEESPRQILSGIAVHYPDPSALAGKSVPVIVNLLPRTIRGLESNGMVLYAAGKETFSTIEPSLDVPPGTLVK
jgi:methionine--tRNA ligase beta chain